MLGGGPSVLYDAVAVVTSDDGATTLAAMPAAKDFVTDAHAHKKFIGRVAASEPLFVAAGLGDSIDDGYFDLSRRGAAKRFVEACRAARLWDRA